MLYIAYVRIKNPDVPEFKNLHQVMSGVPQKVTGFDSVGPKIHPSPKSSIISEMIKSEPTPSFSIFKWINLENPHQHTVNELSPDLHEEVDQKVRRILHKSLLISFASSLCVFVHDLVSHQEPVKALQSIIALLTMLHLIGWLMLPRVSLGLVHDYVFIMAMATSLTLDWTTSGHVNAEVLSFGIVLLTTTTLPFKGPLLRNHVELMMLAIFILARVRYGHDKVSAVVIPDFKSEF